MKYSEHVLQRMEKRGISKKLIEEAIKNPDEIIFGEKGRKIYHKIMNGKLLRVVVEGDVIVTAYMTSKVIKYYRGEGK